MSIIKENGQSYLNHVPEVLQDFLEIKALGTTIDIEMTKYYEAVDTLINDRFIDQMSGTAIERWEKIMQLTSPIDASLESRRNAIKAKILSQPPINLSALKVIIEAFLDVPINIIVHDEPYVVKCTYRGVRDIPDTTPLFKKIYEMIPAHMKVILSYAYQVWNEAGNHTWNVLKSISWYELLMAEVI